MNEEPWVYTAFIKSLNTFINNKGPRLEICGIITTSQAPTISIKKYQKQHPLVWGGQVAFSFHKYLTPFLPFSWIWEQKKCYCIDLGRGVLLQSLHTQESAPLALRDSKGNLEYLNGPSHLRLQCIVYLTIFQCSASIPQETVYPSHLKYLVQWIM